MLIDTCRAGLKTYRNEILMLIVPYLAEISLVLYFDILQTMRHFRQMNSNRFKNFITLCFEGSSI
jgi:hypothetical protein